MTTSMRRPLAYLATVLALLAASTGAASVSEERLLDLDDNALAPDWLYLEADHRTRFELLNDSFRITNDAHQSAFLLRTRIRAGLRPTSWLLFAAELQDSRMRHADPSIAINTSLVNEEELLQAYTQLSGKGPFGGTQTLRAGRLTLSIGDGRLVQRNGYRNTSNAFTGVDWRWQDEEARELRLFWTMPIQRHATDFDRESSKLQFFGGFAALNVHDDATSSGAPHRLELFAFGLLERDEPKRASRNRRFATTGYRLFRKPSAGRFDYQVESVVQTGTVRSSTATSARKLDHLAHFHHVEVGYRFDAPWSPRVVAQYDYMSGDKNRFDSKSQRMDGLFGARVPDFGPTGTYGAFGSSNLNSPGVRLQLAPAPGVTTFVSVRPFWRASAGDVWTTASPLGRSTSKKYIGTQAEVRVRWYVVPKNVRLEAGYARLFKGAVAKSGNAPKGDSDYFYTGVKISF